MDTSNEEMLALNEEMQAANEELQSTNEELEAANEELQSTNEELYTVNEELQAKSVSLEQAYSEINALLNSISYPLLVLDNRSQLVRFNSAAAQLFNLTLASRGHRWQSLPLPDDTPRFGIQLEQVQQNQQAVMAQASSGKSHYLIHINPIFDHDNRASGAIITLFDNTRLFDAEKLNREMQQKLSKAMQYSTLAMAIKDTSGRYELINPSFEQLFGFEGDSATGKTDPQLFSAELAQKWHEAEIAVLRHRNAIQSEEEITLVGDRKLQLLVVRYPLMDEHDIITSIGIQILDISQRIRIERELRLHRDHLQQLIDERTLELVTARELAESANRAKGAFLATISHEIRTPLNILVGMASLLQRKCQLPEQLKYISNINSASNRLLSVIEDILDYTQLESEQITLQPQTFLPHQLVEALQLQFNAEATARGLALQFEFDTALPVKLCGDVMRTEQILHQLLKNALKFTPTGTITVRATRLAEQDELKPIIAFEVEDSGIV